MMTYRNERNGNEVIEMEIFGAGPRLSQSFRVDDFVRCAFDLLQNDDKTSNTELPNASLPAVRIYLE